MKRYLLENNVLPRMEELKSKILNYERYEDIVEIVSSYLHDNYRQMRIKSEDDLEAMSIQLVKCCILCECENQEQLENMLKYVRIKIIGKEE